MKSPEDCAAEALPCTCSFIGRLDDPNEHWAHCWLKARPAVAEKIRAAVVEFGNDIANYIADELGNGQIAAAVRAWVDGRE